MEAIQQGTGKSILRFAPIILSYKKYYIICLNILFGGRGGGLRQAWGFKKKKVQCCMLCFNIST